MAEPKGKPLKADYCGTMKHKNLVTKVAQHDQRFGLEPDLVQQIIAAILRRVKAKRILIYGSRARGDFRATSDIDIAIDCGTREVLARNAIDDEVKTLLKLDIVEIRKVAPKLQEEIEKEGALIYEET